MSRSVRPAPLRSDRRASPRRCDPAGSCGRRRASRTTRRASTSCPRRTPRAGARSARTLALFVRILQPQPPLRDERLARPPAPRPSARRCASSARTTACRRAAIPFSASRVSSGGRSQTNRRTIASGACPRTAHSGARRNALATPLDRLRARAGAFAATRSAFRFDVFFGAVRLQRTMHAQARIPSNLHPDGKTSRAASRLSQTVRFTKNVAERGSSRRSDRRSHGCRDNPDADR